MSNTINIILKCIREQNDCYVHIAYSAHITQVFAFHKNDTNEYDMTNSICYQDQFGVDSGVVHAKLTWCDVTHIAEHIDHICEFVSINKKVIKFTLKRM